ncbi:hypothetical protein EXIGLDRAFT_522193 [Exidia glandulosa HHB12029]|uniref:Uncharacterized protein n=1 Tax=Exidia glandulosa HHB12029 TaxID=1314781 RepID=A0A165J278_EXIGL|nr:hypothetical protein EXIGLDRAFT_522193 [Exidia glandulosa HHB12029]
MSDTPQRSTSGLLSRMWVMLSMLREREREKRSHCLPPMPNSPLLLALLFAPSHFPVSGLCLTLSVTSIIQAVGRV